MGHSLEAKNTGLPLFDDDMPLDYIPGVTKFQLPPPEEHTLLRGVRLWGTYYKRAEICLKQVLEVADETFENVARHTGARVLPHTWGLRSSRHDLISQYSLSEECDKEYLPEGYVLVAEVEALDNTAPILAKFHTDQINGGLEEHQHDTTTPAFWLDGKVQQFVTGVSRKESREATWLVDIEPLLEYNRERDLQELFGKVTLNQAATTAFFEPVLNHI